jgi:serine/threonine-protein kinase SRPK3
MLRFVPEDRATAQQMLDHPWLRGEQGPLGGGEAAAQADQGPQGGGAAERCNGRGSPSLDRTPGECGGQ